MKPGASRDKDSSQQTRYKQSNGPVSCYQSQSDSCGNDSYIIPSIYFYIQNQYLHRVTGSLSTKATWSFIKSGCVQRSPSSYIKWHTRARLRIRSSRGNDTALDSEALHLYLSTHYQLVSSKPFLPLPPIHHVASCSIQQLREYVLSFAQTTSTIINSCKFVVIN